MSMQVIRDRLTAAGLQIPLPESWEGHVPLARLVRWIDLEVPPLSKAILPEGRDDARNNEKYDEELVPPEALAWILEAAGYTSSELPTGPGQIGLLAGLPVPTGLSIPEAYAHAPQRSRFQSWPLALLHRHLRAGGDPAPKLRAVLLPTLRQQLRKDDESKLGPILEAIWGLSGGWQADDAAELAFAISEEESISSLLTAKLTALVATKVDATETVQRIFRAEKPRQDPFRDEVLGLLRGNDASLIDHCLQCDTERMTGPTLLLLAMAVRHGRVSPTVATDLLDALQARTDGSGNDPTGGPGMSGLFQQQHRFDFNPDPQAARRRISTDQLQAYVRATALLVGPPEDRQAFVRSLEATGPSESQLRTLATVALLDLRCRDDESWQEALRRLGAEKTDDDLSVRLVRTLLEGSTTPLPPEIMAHMLIGPNPVHSLLCLPGIVIPASMEPWFSLDDTLTDLDWVRLLQHVHGDRSRSSLLASWMVVLRPHLAPVFADALTQGGLLASAPVAAALLLSPTSTEATPLCLRSISRMTSDGLLADTPENAIELMTLQGHDASRQGAQELLERSGPLARSLARRAHQTERFLGSDNDVSGLFHQRSRRKVRSNRPDGQALERAWMGLPVTPGELASQIRASPQSRASMLESALHANPEPAMDLVQTPELWSEVTSDQVARMVLGLFNMRSDSHRILGITAVDEILAPRGEVPREIRLQIGMLEADNDLRPSVVRLRHKHGWAPRVADLASLTVGTDGVSDTALVRRLMDTDEHHLLAHLGSAPQLWESMSEADVQDIVKEGLRHHDFDRQLAATLVLIGFVLSGRPLPLDCIDVLCAQPMERPSANEQSMFKRFRSRMMGSRGHFARRLAELDDVSDLPGSPAWRAGLVSELQSEPAVLTVAWDRLLEWGSIAHLTPDDAAAQLRAQGPLTPRSPMVPAPQVFDHAGAADVAMWRELTPEVAQTVVLNLLSSGEDRSRITGCMALIGVTVTGHPLTPAITRQLQALRSGSDSDVSEMAWIVSRLLRLCPLDAGPESPSDDGPHARHHSRRRRQRIRRTP